MYGRHWWHGHLRRRGYRVTVPRETIIQVLSDADKHLSVEEIFNEVLKLHPGVGLTTVYRTVELLRNMGFVKKYEFGDGLSRYELEKGSKKPHHHHLVCTRCGKIIDYTDFVDEEVVLLRKVENRLTKKYKFDIKNHQIHFYGICDECK
ncbi:transcriptional repressor [bacterium]|nr:transcriptional repressor [bacterium]